MTHRDDPRVIVAGTVDYLDIPITSDTQLTNQPVAISLDGQNTWHAATWSGDPGTTRTASLLLDETNTPQPGRVDVLVRIDFGTTKPIEFAGQLIVR